MTKSLESLISRNISRWEQERRRCGNQEYPCGQRPIITISRETGGGSGLCIASFVAERLRFELYEKNLVDEIANSAHVRKQVIESLDERILDKISEYITQGFESGGLTYSEYLKYLSKVVLALGQHGWAVIVGRGAHFILNPAQTLRVRLVAPLEYRIKQLAEQKRTTEREARAEIMGTDSERLAFCKKHFNQDVRDPSHYDLLLNYAVLSPAHCAEMVEIAFRRRFAKELTERH